MESNLINSNLLNESSNVATGLKASFISDSDVILGLPRNTSSSVVFIDANVNNYEQLTVGIVPSTEVYFLKSGEDAITQITETLLQKQGISSLYIISHGQAGSLDFSSGSLNAANINNYAKDFGVWDKVLTENADIFLYGCNVAENALGKSFVDLLAQMTGADVAASDDLTGSATLSGDWELEYKAGTIEASQPFSSQALDSYSNLLNTGQGNVDNITTISNIGSTVSYTNNQVILAPNVTISDADGPGETLDAAKVAIMPNFGFTPTEDRLGIQGQGGTSGVINGLNWLYDSTDGILLISGTANLATYESVLRQVTYSNTNPNHSASGRDIVFNITPTKRYYEYVADNNIDWINARAAASGRTLNGMRGYLATITSASENAIVTSFGQGGWIGASDEASEGTWRWMTGPEAGTRFWSGTSTGTPVNGSYTNWYPGEPNSLNNENYAHIFSRTFWNDISNAPVAGGYIVEYGGADLQQTGGIGLDIKSAQDVPMVSIKTLDGSATETSGNTGTFRISRDRTNGDLSVYLTRNGTAVPGTDYSLEIGTNRITSTILNVVIPDGQSFVDITLTPIDDSLQESAELVQLFLAAGNDYNISAVGSDASITIEDNDISNIVGWEIAGTGDFNGDGKQDILQRNSQSSAVRIWRLDANNTSQIVNLPTMDSSWEIASIAKFNSDTRTDILWHNSSTGENSIWVMNENTPPQVIALPAFTNNHVQKIEYVGDFDGDGDADILWRNHTLGWNRIWQIDNGSLVRTVELPTIGNVNQQIKYVADFDSDSDLDILWSDVKTGFTSMWEMNGANFGRGIAFGNVETDYQIAHVGNFDSDKDLDILWYNSRTGFTSIWEMNGVNLLRGIELPTVSDTNIKIQKVADFDSDRDLDILWYNSLTGFSCIWEMNGTSLARGIELPRVANTNIKISNVADFDGDSDSDILWYDSTTGSTSLWQISNANFSNGVALPNQSSGFNVHSVGDFDGNGKLDIVWYNSTNSNTKIWLTDGTNILGNEILLV